ncbi:MAG: RNA-binding cell elongation regulator Jag/EloR [Oscillospiraceae bacterium]
MPNKSEVTTQAQTVEQAIILALAELEVKEEQCNIEILEQPKKGFFGKVKSDAVVRVCLKTEEKEKDEVSSNQSKAAKALEYLKDITRALELNNLTFELVETDTDATISINGDDVGTLIGHHGETLDALQYLVTLSTNQGAGDYYRISINGGNYREKREKTLQELALRIADRVKKTGKSQMLEPMNPYERRIIHSVVSEIQGVSSKSKGDDPNRRVVILSETQSTFTPNNNKKPTPRIQEKPERTMEEILKNDFKNKEKSADLYSKIEF